MTTPAQRLAEGHEGVAQLRTEMSTWADDLRASSAPGAHRSQIDTLCDLLDTTLDGVAAATPDPASATTMVAAYGDARLLDARVAYCRRLLQWYVVRFDQRRLEGLRGALLGADEVVWSCWTRTFTAADVERPPVPLPFIDNDSIPWASFHDALPGEAQPPSTDAFFQDRIHELPIPVIGLPPLCIRRPWWLVVAVHETGHHVHHMLSKGLVDETERALTARATDERAPLTEAALWGRWSRELFADVFASVFAGAAAVWAIEELERSSVVGITESRPTYPPAVIRLAAASHAVVATRGSAPEVTLTDEAGLDVAPLQGLFDRVPPIVDTLLDLPLGATTLRDLAPPARTRAEAQARWAAAFAGGAELREQTVEAAIGCVGGAVSDWRRRTAEVEDADPAPLRDLVLDVLPDCRADGDRAGTRPLDEAAVGLLDALLSPGAPL